jgi:hypothetical protein
MTRKVKPKQGVPLQKHYYILRFRDGSYVHDGNWWMLFCRTKKEAADIASEFQDETISHSEVCIRRVSVKLED